MKAKVNIGKAPSLHLFHTRGERGEKQKRSELRTLSKGGRERKRGKKGKGRRKEMINLINDTLALWMKTSVQLASMARAFSKQVLHFCVSKCPANIPPLLSSALMYICSSGEQVAIGYKHGC